MRALLLAAALALVGAPLSGQRPQTRQGFWIGFGIGYGQAEITCDGCTGTKEPGFTSFLRAGGTLNQRVARAATSH